MMMKHFRIFLLVLFPALTASAQQPCDVIQIQPNPNGPVYYSPDSSQYFINIQDDNGVFQIYVGNAGNPNTVCISDTYTNGNCCGLFRSWETRNKLQVQWHASGDYIICAVEKEFYNELLYVPYSLRLGWLQSGIWMDVWAVKPDGSQWYSLANTIRGVTGPAFTPNGLQCVWAEMLDTGSLTTDVFGIWKLRLSDFDPANPSFTTTDITPAGARWVEPGNFSPNGHSVLISSDIGLTNAEGQDQYILDITNGNIVNLTNSPMIWDEHGVFSPDGNKILFMSSYPYQSDTNSYHTLTIKAEFMLMDTDGSNIQQLTHFRDTGYVESSEGIAATGFWTPDGSRIYAQSLVFPDYENWIIDFYGNCGNNLTSVDDAHVNDFQLYPNPVQNLLTIETGYPLHDASLSIVNTLGQTIRTFSPVNGSLVNVETSGLEKGLYFLRLESENQKAAQIFIKQ